MISSNAVSGRRSEGFANRATSPETTMNSGLNDTEFFCPSRETLRLALKRQQMVLSRIPALLRLTGPSTVALFVNSIIINAVKRETSRRIAHVMAKDREIMPLLANGDAAATIIFVRTIFRVFASLNHVLPNLVDFRSMLSVSPATFAASTTLRVPTAQVTPRHGFLCSAITDTKPESPPFSAAKKSFDNKPAKTLALEVFDSAVRWLRMRLSHDGALCDRVVLRLEPAREYVSPPACFIVAV